MGEKKREEKAEIAIFFGRIFVRYDQRRARSPERKGSGYTVRRQKSDIYAYTPPVRLRCARARYIMKI